MAIGQTAPALFPTAERTVPVPGQGEAGWPKPRLDHTLICFLSVKGARLLTSTGTRHAANKVAQPDRDWIQAYRGGWGLGGGREEGHFRRSGDTCWVLGNAAGIEAASTLGKSADFFCPKSYQVLAHCTLGRLRKGLVAYSAAPLQKSPQASHPKAPPAITSKAPTTARSLRPLGLEQARKCGMLEGAQGVPLGPRFHPSLALDPEFGSAALFAGLAMVKVCAVQLPIANAHPGCAQCPWTHDSGTP